MTALSWLPPGTVSALGWTLVHFVWQGAAAAVVLAAANAMLRGRSPRARYAVALVTLLAMLALPLVTFQVVRGVSAEPNAQAPVPAATLLSMGSTPAAEGPGPAQPAAFDPMVFLPAVVVGWAVGVLLFSLRALGGWALVWRLRRSGRLLPELTASAAVLARRMRLWRPVRVCESLLVEVPTAIGWLKPMILLPPATLLGLTPAQLELVLAHELAHIRRLDQLAALLQAVAETLLFYHPLVWWVSHRLRVEREECCDDAAVAQCGNALAYARTLTTLAELRLQASGPVMALSGGSLAARVRRLVSPADGASIARWPVALLVLLVAGLAVFGPATLRAAAQNGSTLASDEPVFVSDAAGPSAAVPSPDGSLEPAPRRDARADERFSGTWTVGPTGWKHETERGAAVQLTLQMRSQSGKSNWNSSQAVALSDLRGLTAEQLRAETADAKFQIVRDAGTIDMDGRFRKGNGAGHFSFTPNAEFVRALGGMGYGSLDADTVFSLALHDVSRDFIRELAALGYEKVPLDQLIAMRIHGATPAFVRELKALGYTVDVDQLIAFRIHGVSPEFVRSLKDLGYDGVEADQLVAFRIHGVSVEFVRDLKALGYEPPPALDELVAMRIHGVSADFVRALKGLGYERVPADDLVAMRIHGVSPDFIKRVNGREGKQVPVDRLVSLRIHGNDR